MRFTKMAITLFLAAILMIGCTSDSLSLEGALDSVIDSAKDTVNDATDSMKDFASEKVDSIKDNVGDSVESAKDKLTPGANSDNSNNGNSEAPLNGELKIHFIDVGQADATFIEVKSDDLEHRIMIDTGDWKSTEAPDYLESIGVEDIDLLIGTHPHADHIGQMDFFLDNYDVGEVWMSGDVNSSKNFERVIDSIDRSGVSYNEPRAGETYSVGPIDILVVSPETINGDLNDGSIAVKLTYGDNTFLLTGDAETNAEKTMVGSGLDLEADVLKMGHHGSKTSSTQSFLDKVQPEIGIISSGANNEYGHPHQEVIDRSNKENIAIYSTAANGNIILTSDGVDITLETDKKGKVTAGSK